jgi:hypothetical protein
MTGNCVEVISDLIDNECYNLIHEARDNHVFQELEKPGSRFVSPSHSVAGFLYARMLFGTSERRSVKVTTSAIKLKSPDELLAVVPYVLGFKPSRSIVVLCLRDHRLGLTQRLDLPLPEHAHRVASALMPSLIREEPDSVILVGFENRAGESLPAIEALTEALARHSMQIHDRLIVRNGRWRSMDCSNTNCCPAEGALLAEAADVSGVTAEFVGRGVAPHPDREALAAQLEPSPQAEDVDALVRSLLLDRVEATSSITREAMFASWMRILDISVTAPTITSQNAALAAISLLDVEVRDGLVACLCPGALALQELSEEVQELLSALEEGLGEEGIDLASIGGQNAVQDRLIRLCAMLPDHVAAPALSVLASFAWFRGDGALTRVALAGRCAASPTTASPNCCYRWSTSPSGQETTDPRIHPKTWLAANAAGLCCLRAQTSPGQTAWMTDCPHRRAETP